MKHTYHIGLDAHAKTTAIAIAGSDGSLEFHGNCSSSNLSVERTLRKLAARLGTEFQSLKVRYEAGPTGLGSLAAVLDGVEQRGIDAGEPGDHSGVGLVAFTMVGVDGAQVDSQAPPRAGGLSQTSRPPVFCSVAGIDELVRISGQGVEHLAGERQVVHAADYQNLTESLVQMQNAFIFTRLTDTYSPDFSS